VQRTPRGKADLLRKENPKAADESGSTPGLTTNLSKRRGRKPVQQPGEKSKDEADKNQTAKRADEKQNEARKPTATKQYLAEEGQALETSRVRIVLVVQASSGSTQTVSDQADTPASPAKKPKSPK
ncbi:MAG: hypothetical protein GY888_17675, partial [Planctomycetaceae bacterium]|nr:hypothetical protein [Planctomycetaceae bacterium]